MVGKLTRNDQLSASRLPTLMNASPWNTQNDLLAEFVAIDAGEQPSSLAQNDAMLFGDLTENIILTEAAKRLGCQDLQLDFDQAFEHATLPLGASLDATAVGSRRWAADPAIGIYTPQGSDMVDLTGLGIIGAKFTSAPPETRPAPHRGAPWQLQGQMMCRPDAKWGAVAVLYTTPIELRIFLYAPDDAIQGRIVQAVQDFEDRRKNIDWYPALSPEDAATAYSRVDDAADEIDLTENVDATVTLEQLVHAKKQKAMAEEDISEMTTGLMEIMGSHERAIAMVGNTRFQIKWPMRTYKAQPEKITPAKPERTIRSKTLTVKDID